MRPLCSAALSVALLATSLAGQGSRYGTPETLARLADQAITESSGLVASRTHPGLFWTHNDSGRSSILFLVGRDGKTKGTWRVRDARLSDWEDIAWGPGPEPGRPYLYLGDIGDNDRRRRSVSVYRVPEPAVARPGQVTERPVELRFRYPDGRHDAEALLVHPKRGDLYIVTKARGRDSATGVYVARAPLRARGTLTLKRVASIDFPGDNPLSLLLGRVTGGDIAPDGQRVVLCGYFGAYEAVAPQGGFDRVWSGTWHPIAVGLRQQGEAITYRLDGKALLLTSEGRNGPLVEVGRIP